MRSTFSSYKLKVALYVNDFMVGVASVNLSHVINKNNEWKDRINIIDRYTEDLIGFVDVELQLWRNVDTPAMDKSPSKNNESLAASKDLLNQAAKELEIWKMEQKKKFNENLLDIEQQHLNLLGQEWKEREKVRQHEMEEKLAVMKGLEDELRKELEKIETERREFEEKRKNLLIEHDKLDQEKRNVKNEKLAIVDKLKQQIRDKDTQLSVKDSEIEILTKKVKLLETESKRPPPISRLKSTSSDKSKKDENLASELSQVNFLRTRHKDLIPYLSNETIEVDMQGR